MIDETYDPYYEAEMENHLNYLRSQREPDAVRFQFGASISMYPKELIQDDRVVAYLITDEAVALWKIYKKYVSDKQNKSEEINLPF